MTSHSVNHAIVQQLYEAFDHYDTDLVCVYLYGSLAPGQGHREWRDEVWRVSARWSLTMIRKLAKTLHIPADVLIQPYATEDSPAAS